MPSDKQIYYMKTLLHRGGLPWGSAAKHGELLAELSTEDFSKAISYVSDKGLSEVWIDENSDIAQNIIGKIQTCGICHKPTAPINKPETCSC